MELVARLQLRTEPVFIADVLRHEGRPWIRITTPADPTVHRAWSRVSDDGTDAEGLVTYIEEALRSASVDDIRTHRALDLWPDGWEFWPGIPGPIADALLDPGFKASLESTEPTGR